MPQTPQSCPNEEAQKTIEQIRDINRRCRDGEITFEERVRLHNVLVEGIGDLDAPEIGKGVKRKRPR